MDFQLVWFERKGGLALGAIKRAGPTKVQVIDARGKLQRIPHGRLLDTLSASVAAANHETVGRKLSERLAGWEAVRAVLEEQALHAQLEPDHSYSLAELAELTLGEAGDDATSRLALGLLNDKGRLLDCVRAKGGAVVRQDGEVYEQLRTRRADQLRRQETLVALRGWWESGAEQPTPELEGWVRELIDYALRAPVDVSRELREIARELGAPNADALLTLLEGRGLLPRHANEVPERNGLRLAFSPEVDAEVAAEEDGGGDDLDLRAHLTLAIDPPGTHEADDALSLWEADGETWIAVHIARPYWAPGGAIDQAARQRASTAYFDDRVVPLLPAGLVARYTLAAGVPRPALSWIARVTDDGLADGRFAATQIEVDHAWTYEQADTQPELEPWLVIAERLRAARFDRGARSLERARVRFRLDESGRVERSVDGRSSPSSRVVGECMVHYNQQAAQALAEAGLRALFRGQASSQGPSPVQVSPDPSPHHGLGVEAYAQATSPLRRYGDWIVQQQVLAMLGRGQALPPVAIAELCEGLPKRERRIRQAEDERQRYLQCAWLRANPAPLHGWLVSASPGRWRVHVDELAREQNVRPPRWSAEPGAKLVLEAQDVEPRARTFVLRVTGQRES